MIIDFAVTNYRSIKDEVVLSAVAQNRRASLLEPGTKRRVPSDDGICPPWEIEGRGIKLLPTLAIFGPNASGKSNVIRALDSLLTLMAYGSGERGETLREIRPFGLDPELRRQPTGFELRAAVDGYIYSYSLGLNRQRILWESLHYTPPPPAKTRKLYARKWNEQTGQTSWERNGIDFQGPHIQLQDSLEDDESYMSLLKRVKVKSVQRLTEWLGARWPGVGLGSETIDRFMAAFMSRDSKRLQRRVAQMLRKFDTDLSDVRVVESSDPSGEHSKTLRIRAVHDTPHGKVVWGFQEESLGSQRLWVLAHRTLDALERSSPVVLDELDDNIHPLVSRSIINLFQNPITNPKRTQLIFTSHDNQLQRLLRRDQIWFTEKNPDGSTRLYPLTDFRVRNDLAIPESYLDGRFGAVPILPDDESLLRDESLTG